MAAGSDDTEDVSSSTLLCLEACFQCKTRDAVYYFECSRQNCVGPAGDPGDPRRRVQLCLQCSQEGCPFCRCHIQPADLTSVTNKPTTQRTSSAGEPSPEGQRALRDTGTPADLCTGGQSLEQFNQQLKAVADKVQQRMRELKRNCCENASDLPEIAALVQEAEALFDRLKREHNPDCATYHWMISLYARSNNRDKVESWAYQMETSGKWSTDAYNSVISSYATLPKGIDRADMWFKKMIEKGLQPDTKSYTVLIKACEKSRDKNRAQMYFERMKEAGLKPDAWTFSHLISLCKSDADIQLIDAKPRHRHSMSMYLDQVMHAAREVNNRLLSFFIGTYLTAPGKLGRLERAEQLWEDMLQAGEKPFGFTFSSILKVCASAGNSVKAEYFYNKMLEAGESPDVVTFTTIITAFIETGDVQGAEEWFGRMQEAGIQANLATFTCLITVCSKLGDVENAAKWFGLMQEAGLEPSERTFKNLIRAGLARGDLLEAEKWLMQMCDAGITPSLTTFDILIDSCAKSANLHQAERWFALMQEKGVPPDVKIFNSMLETCSNQGSSTILGLRRRVHTEEARRNQRIWFLKMGEMGVQPNESTHAILTEPWSCLPCH